MEAVGILVAQILGSDLALALLGGGAVLRGVFAFRQSSGNFFLRCLSLMTVILGLVWLIVPALSRADRLVFSPELGVLIGEGREATWVLALVVLLISIGAGLGWASSHGGARPFVLWLLLASLVLGAWFLIQHESIPVSDQFLDLEPPNYFMHSIWSLPTLPFILWSFGWLAPWLFPLFIRMRLFWRERPHQAEILANPRRVTWAVALTLFVATVFHLFLSDFLPVSLVAATSLACWLILFELALHESPHALFQSIYQLTATAVAAGQQKALAFFHGLFKVDSVSSLLLKILVGVIILIIVAELPNTGKTVIVSFRTLRAEKSKDLGDALSQQLLNRLGELRTHYFTYLTALPNKTQTAGKEPTKAALRFGPAIAPDELSVALSKTPDIDLPGGIKIPISFAVSLIQTPVRGLLGVRVITGIVEERQSTSYAVMASSSTGETWRVEYPNASQDAKTCVPKNKEWSDPQGMDSLADHLAFGIFSSDPRIPRSSMTTSWDAYQYFRRGVNLVHDALNSESEDDANNAIECLKLAIEKDQNFGLAYHWLGMVLQLDNRLKSASEAYRNSIANNSSFYPSLMSRASLLYFPDLFSEPASTPVLSRKESIEAASDNEVFAKTVARTYFSAVIHTSDPSIPDSVRAQAYSWMCRDFLDPSTRGLGDQEAISVGYFFCNRAERYYRKVQAKASPIITYRMSAFSAYPWEDAQVLAEVELDLEMLSMHKNLQENSLYHVVKVLNKPDDNSSAQDPRSDLLLEEVLYGTLKEATQKKQPEDEKKQMEERKRPFFELPPTEVLGHLEIQHYKIQEGDVVDVRQDKTVVLNCDQPPAQHRWLAYPASPRRYRDAAKNDPNLRIWLAVSAYRSGDTRLLCQLTRDADEHVRRADQIFVLDSSDPLYPLALSEYQKAISLDASNVIALNAYAARFYEWQFKQPREPKGEHTVARAQEYAKRAVQLSDQAYPPGLRAIFRSTLGEVLLLQGQFAEAYQILGKAKELAPTHHIYDSIRWDFAQACLCSANRNKQKAKKNKFMKQGQAVLKGLMAHDAQFEFRRFADEYLNSEKCWFPLM